jgi:triphosphoribosyl-dephospho-CoA synthase
MVKNKMKELSIRLLESDRLFLLEDALYEIDSEFKELGINPGTTADLTVATLLAVFIQNHLALS